MIHTGRMKPTAIAGLRPGVYCMATVNQGIEYSKQVNEKETAMSRRPNGTAQQSQMYDMTALLMAHSRALF